MSVSVYGVSLYIITYVPALAVDGTGRREVIIYHESQGPERTGRLTLASGYLT